MGANKVKIGIWSVLLLALVIFVTGRLVVTARTRVAESTLTATAESTAKTWYEHHVVHMRAFTGLKVQNVLETTEVATRHDASEFGNVYFYRIYDRYGRLYIVSDQADGDDAGGTEPAAPPVEDLAKVRSVLAGGETVTEIARGWRRNDPSRYFSRSVLPIEQDGEIIGAAEVFVDISADRATIYSAFFKFSVMQVTILVLASLIPISAVSYAWYRMAAMNRDLADARDKARQAEEAKSRFLANMSHEIRTPLNGIMGMAELLDETRMTEVQRSYSATIVNASSALLTIINDVLDFSKIEAGKVTIVNRPFDLHDCVQDAAALLVPAGNAKGVELCVDFQTPLPAWVIGDEARLRQCLLNVAGNAVKFTEEGHVTIRVSEAAGDRVEIAVSDTGVGVPPDKIETIFRDFEQAETGHSRSQTGTGLGLTITRRLLHLMGGEIKVENRPGRGAVFRMSLPLPATAPPEHARRDLPVLFFDPAALRGKTAIVVDDLEINRRILAARLAGFGMESRCFDSAAAALEALRDPRQPRPDIVISDHHMPGMDGAGLLRALRELPGAGELPFVILSSGDLEPLRAGFSRDDIERCLSKPVRTDLLFKTLCSAMNLAAGASDADPAAAPANAPDTSSLRVCLAEDNKTNQFIVRKMIAARVARFTVWETGQAAVDAYLDERPDLILMDISMPVKDGLTAARDIRALERRAGLAPCTIVALTAHALTEDRDRAAAAGMNGFLGKPLRKRELLDTLEAVAHRRAAPAEVPGPARDAG